MKLRNKKTGEIKEVIVGGYPVSGETKMWECSEIDMNEETGYKTLGTYSSLTELNEEWEDYEEPKEYWFIDIRYPKVEPKKDINLSNSMRKRLKEIGNYFETKGEAEKAVEKLKAWKRLKDRCNISFSGLNRNIKGRPVSVNLDFNNEGMITVDEAIQTIDDLNLLFGGEDENNQ